MTSPDNHQAATHSGQQSRPNPTPQGPPNPTPQGPPIQTPQGTPPQNSEKVLRDTEMEHDLPNSINLFRKITKFESDKKQKLQEDIQRIDRELLEMRLAGLEEDDPRLLSKKKERLRTKTHWEHLEWEYPLWYADDVICFQDETEVESCIIHDTDMSFKEITSKFEEEFKIEIDTDLSYLIEGSRNALIFFQSKKDKDTFMRENRAKQTFNTSSNTKGKKGTFQVFIKNANKFSEEQWRIIAERRKLPANKVRITSFGATLSWSTEQHANDFAKRIIRYEEYKDILGDALSKPNAVMKEEPELPAKNIHNYDYVLEMHFPPNTYERTLRAKFNKNPEDPIRIKSMWLKRNAKNKTTGIGLVAFENPEMGRRAMTEAIDSELVFKKSKLHDYHHHFLTEIIE